MSYEEKNTVVTLISHFLILGYYLMNLIPALASGNIDRAALQSLFTTVIILGIVVTIIGMILAYTGESIYRGIRSGGKDTIDTTTDERDLLIKGKGSRVEGTFLSVGVVIALVSFIIGHSELPLFALLLFFLIASQVAGDVNRLILYRMAS